MPLHFHTTRLAPSPTGALHLGHARTFLITWWLARQAGAKIIMRMEDLDAGRAKPESVQQAYDDLRWLGMDWDPWENKPQSPNSKTQNSAPDTQHPNPDTVVQSDRLALYQQVLEQLWRQDAIYPCTCSRAQIAASVAAAASAPHAGDPSIRYPGTCASRHRLSLHHTDLKEAERAVTRDAGTSPCWRLRVPTTPIAFTDLIAGPQTLNIEEDVGDFPLTRFDGTPAYQLACVVDDHLMNIDMVIRGDDLLPSTPRQIALYQTLGWQPPQFAHVPLVVGPDDKRLAKRHGESRIAQFRAAGVSPERIVGWAAWRSGQLASPREVSAAEVIKTFDLAQLPKGRIVLTPEDLQWLA